MRHTYHTTKDLLTYWDRCTMPTSDRLKVFLNERNKELNNNNYGFFCQLIRAVTIKIKGVYFLNTEIMSKAHRNIHKQMTNN